MIALSLSLKNRKVTIVGGGAVAERRISLLIHEGAQIIVISPEVTDVIENFHKEKRLLWIQKPYEEGMLAGSDFVFIATDIPAVNELATKEANKIGAFISRADNHEESQIALPALVQMKNLQFAVYTNKVSPRISRLIRQDLEKRYESLERIMPKIKAWRQELKECLGTPKEREEFWRTYLDDKEFEKILRGDSLEVEEEIENAISSIRVKP